jgi:CMP-N,N'-diacetyllegionaminic acid synthase
MFAGRPLIAWTIEAALRCQSADDVIVSTDDESIAEIARELGAAVPFLRPAGIAGDDSPGIETVLHALREIPSHQSVILLQPTSPLRTAADIDDCVGMARECCAPSAVSVTHAPKHPYWMYTLDQKNHVRPVIAAPHVANRQALPRVYVLNGAVYYAETDWLRNSLNFVTDETVGYIMPAERSVDLDTMLDWRFAELLLQEQQ